MVQVIINRRTGRKRKTNVVRDASGKSRGEILDLSVVYNQPHRRGQKNPKSELLGYPLGRLRHEGLIDEAQLQAGNAWASMVRAYSRMIGLRIGSPKSGSLTDAVATGFYVWEGDGDDVDPEEQERRRKRLRGKYDLCHDRLHEVGRTLGPASAQSAALLKALRKVAIEERYGLYAETPRHLAEAVIDNIYNIDFGRPQARRVVEVRAVERSFQLLDEILLKGDIRLIELLHTFYISTIRARETHLGEALILSWAVCEQVLSLAWQSLQDDLQSASNGSRMNQTRRKKFGGRDYTASVIVEILELSGKLDADLYANLEMARKARNSWAHDLKLPTAREVQAAMEAANEMLQSFLGITLKLQQTAEQGAFPLWHLNNEVK